MINKIFLEENNRLQSEPSGADARRIKKYIIIGNSAAGIAAIRTLRSLDPQGKIICISDEHEKPYNKCFLADYISGDKSEQETYTMGKEQLEKLAIDMRYGTAVVGINPQEKYITLQDGTTETYDKLMLATGTRPIVPNIDHIGLYNNVFAFHNLNNAQQLLSFMSDFKPKRALVIGAGLSGVEITDALTRHNVAVHLIERSGHLLSAHLTDAASEFLERAMHKHGVHVHLNKTVVKVEGSGNVAQKVHLFDGTIISTDLIVVTAGLVRNAELARSAGLTIDQYGLVVDAHLQTSANDIYAAGDLISTNDQISGRSMASCTWPDAMQQGRYAAYAMAGQPKPYPGAAIITSSAFFDLKFYSCGAKDNPELTVVERSGDHYYRRYLLQGDILKGFILLDDGKKFAQLKAALLTKQPINCQLLD